MTDNEIVKIIAKKVMGWLESSTARFYWVDSSAQPVRIVNWHEFSPLTSDVDCMLAWDKFSKEYAWTIGFDPNESEYDVQSWNDRGDTASIATGPDRRRAMCECMAEAVNK